MTYQWRLLLLLAIILACASNADANAEVLTLRNVEEQLQKKEALFDDLVAGTEKHVRWADQPREKTEFSIVYLHGFSASAPELSPLIERVADKLQANVFFTRLKGHGRSDDAMAEGSVAGWQQDSIEAYQIGQLLGTKVIVIGTSTGATLSTWLNAQCIAQSMYANVQISPNFAVKNKAASILKWSVGLWLAKLINGNYHSFEPLNEFHGQFWTERYPLEAIVPMLNLLDDVETLDKSSIKTPQLIVYSPDDKVIEVGAIEQTVKQMTSATVTHVPFTLSQDPYQHVLVGRASSIEPVDEMLGIIESFINGIRK